MIPYYHTVPNQISEIQSKINSDLRRICEWMQANKLTLNTKKSKFMVIGGHARLSKIDSIVILANNTPLEQVSSFPYLSESELLIRI